MSPVDESFDWDDANTAHLARHGITPREAEEVIRRDPKLMEVHLRSGEIRRKEVGETASGKILTIVTIARGYKIRVVTGWPSDRTERRYWLAP